MKVGIKSYTDLPQSQRLAKILNHESADMAYIASATDDDGETLYTAEYKSEIIIHEADDYINCWSLAALLNVMPKDESIDCAISFGYYNGKGEYIEKWVCSFEKEGETTDDFIIETTDGDNHIDACVEMILKLHELNLL